MSLTNDQLADKAREYKTLGAELEGIKTRRETISSEIVGELHRRKRNTVGVDGVTVTLSSRRIGYAVDVLKQRLSAAAYKRVTKVVVDADAMAAEIKADGTVVEHAKAAEVRSRPFPKVTIDVAEAKAA